MESLDKSNLEWKLFEVIYRNKDFLLSLIILRPAAISQNELRGFAVILDRSCTSDLVRRKRKQRRDTAAPEAIVNRPSSPSYSSRYEK